MGDYGDFSTRWVRQTLPPDFRGGVLRVETPDPDHPRAGRIARKRLFAIYDENADLAGTILRALHDGTLSIEQAADLVRERGVGYHIRICATPDDLISAIDQILSSTRVNAWDDGGRHAWDEKGYFVNVFWRE